MRCKACNIILTKRELSCQDNDWEYCNICKMKSDEEWEIGDKDYVHSMETSVMMDGSVLTIDMSYYLPTKDDPDIM